MRSDIKEKQRLRPRKLRLTAVGDPPCWPCDTPLSEKVGTKFRRQVAVAQSVYFICRLKATEGHLYFFDGRAVTQAVCCQLPTSAVRVYAQVKTYGICGGQSGTGGGFLRVLGFLCQSFIPPIAAQSSSRPGTIGQDQKVIHLFELTAFKSYTSIRVYVLCFCCFVHVICILYVICFICVSF
jgi:hypothetical protein